jgi:hypothetical protein
MDTSALNRNDNHHYEFLTTVERTRSFGKRIEYTKELRTSAERVQVFWY